jgi:oligopeptide transport system substrate-binding protein
MQQISRRGFARLSRYAALGCALILGGGLAMAPVTAQADKFLRVANMGEPNTLDPHIVSGTWENRILGNMFLGLLTEARDGSDMAGAAESWTVDGGGTVYTFKIRDHVWSDGKPVTAGDFVFSLRRVLDPKTAAEYASLLYPIKNSEAANTGKADLDAIGVRAIDDQTLEITLEAPTPYFLSQLTHYTAWPVPKHVIENHGDAWTKKANIVSNGAYVLDEYMPNTHVKLVRNPKFYDAANVNIDRIVYFPGEDRTAGLKRFRAGEVDVMTDFSSDQFSWMKENLASETRIAPYLGIYYYPFNTRKPPFDDIRVRQALSMAIDRETIVDKVMGTGEIAAYSFVPPGVGNYGTPSYATWKGMSQADRVVKAKELLEQAGYNASNPLEFVLRYNTSENHKRIAIAVSAMWKKALGVKVELFNSEVKVHYADLKKADFQIARAGWIADYDDAQNFLYLLETRTGANNYGGFSNPEFDRLMFEASKMVDLKQRAELMRKAEAIVSEEQPIAPIYYYVSKQVVSTKVKGWIDNARDIHRARWLDLQ